MSFPFSKLAFTESSRMTSAVVGVSLAAVGTAIYLSPAGNHTKQSAPESTVQKSTQAQQLTTPTPSASSSTPTPTKTKTTPKPGKTSVKVVRPAAKTDVVVVKVTGGKSVVTTTSSAVAKTLHCWNFTYQQDAQAVYVANLSDPGGLDGAVGPYNGDGLACNQLPKDPNRAASTPVGAFVPTAASVPTKAELVSPAKKFYGVSTDELPGSTPAYDQIYSSAGKAPSMIEWFDTWDHPYDATGAKVKQSWAVGALPVLTWMPEAKGGTKADQTSYSLSHIAAGDWDSYLYSYAAQVVKTDLPMVIRFAHEMNGYWYPWSAGWNSKDGFTDPNGVSQGIVNTPALYKAAWQHVWNIFEQTGANKDVIWAWTPVKAVSTSMIHTSGYTSYSEDYPGDQYVDWVGMSGYEYKYQAGKFSYGDTFSTSFNQLKTVAPSKKILIAETAASEAVTVTNADGTVTRTDHAADKATWTTQSLAGFAADPQVAAFVWFNNYVNGVHYVDGQATETNWDFRSSPQALAAFKAGVTNTAFSAGVAPDGTGS